MAPITQPAVAELIETCIELSRQHESIRLALASLPESFAAVRATLNQLHQIVETADHPDNQRRR